MVGWPLGGLGGDSDGHINLEIPNEHYAYYSHLVEVGNQLHIYDSYDSPNEMKGMFSTLSKTLALKTLYGFFDGKCNGIK